MRRPAALLLLALACAAPPPPREAPGARPAPPAPRAEPPAADCTRIESIEVHKSARRLVAICDGGARVRMHVALGQAPLGTKLASGDSRTPEGRYRIAAPARTSRYHRFILIDYPSRADAEAGLRSGRIDASVFEQLREALDAGAVPPQDTALGGYIGLHGEGPRWRGHSETLDWTTGCIAVRDDEIEFLAERLEPGTPLVILP